MARFVFVLSLAACHPRFSAGFDSTAKTTGPLAHLQAVPRLAAVTDLAPPPAEGRNYSASLGFGDKNFTLGVAVRGNNISKSMFDLTGPQYLSAAGAVEFRYNILRFRHVAANLQLSPTRTILIDSTSGDYTWGSGVRAGGGLAVMAGGLAIYADAYQEKAAFFDGPAKGVSTRTGVTVGIAFQP